MTVQEFSLEKRLKELRSAKKLSQKEVGDFTGLARATVNSIESGKQRPSVEFLIKFGELTNLSIDFILDRNIQVANLQINSIFNNEKDIDTESVQELKIYIKNIEDENHSIKKRFDNLQKDYNTLLDKLKNMQKTLSNIIHK